jgi:hypothetical protein
MIIILVIIKLVQTILALSLILNILTFKKLFISVKIIQVMPVFSSDIDETTYLVQAENLEEAKEKSPDKYHNTLKELSVTELADILFKVQFKVYQK